MKGRSRKHKTIEDYNPKYGLNKKTKKNNKVKRICKGWSNYGMLGWRK